MNKNVIIGLVVVLLAAGGYYQFSYKPAQEAAAQKLEEEAAAKAAAEAQTTESATTATTGAPEATAAATAEALAVLDPANFDAARVTALIDASTLTDDVKATLKNVVSAAASNAALVEPAIAQVKTALGL